MNDRNGDPVFHSDTPIPESGTVRSNDKIIVNWAEGMRSADATDHSSLIGKARDFWETVMSPGSPGASLRVGRFVLGGLLGSGGFGVVRVATDPVTGREVALKLPRPHTMVNADSCRRFVREAEIAALLDHPNIVPVYEAGQAGPFAYIASALIDGPTLRDWQAERGQPEFRLAARITALVADGVAHAHERGILHRDIKPGNILLAQPDDATDPAPKLTDFGLARLLDGDDDLSQTGQAIGTANYMSPEQAAGRRREVDVRSDVWALGAVLYEMLTGRAPFIGESPAEVRLSVIQDELIPPSRFRPGTPADLEAVCRKCLEKDPTRRYARADELAGDLRRWLAGEATTARPPGAVRRAWLAVRKHPIASSMSLFAVVALTLAFSALLYHQSVLSKINSDLEETGRELREEKARLREKNDALRNRLYTDKFKSIQELAASGQREALVRALDELRPGKDESDLRGWEWHYYWGLAHPQSRLVLKHEGMAHKVRFHPTDHALISWGADGTVRLFDTKTNTRGPVWQAHAKEANDAVWSPDGKTLAVSGDSGEVALLDWPTGHRKRTLSTKEGKVFELMFVKESPFLIGITERGPVVWDLEGDDHWLAMLPGIDAGTVKVVNVDPNFATLLVGHRQNLVERYAVQIDLAKAGANRLWFLPAFRLQDGVEGRADEIRHIEPLPNGSAAFSTRYSGIGFLVNHPAAAAITFPIDHVTTLSIAPEGKLACVGTSDGKLALVSITGDAIGPTWLAEDRRIIGSAFSPGGNLLATACENGEVRLYQCQNKIEQLTRIEGGRPDAFLGTVPGRPWLVCLRANSDPPHHQTIEVWNHQTREVLRELNLDSQMYQRRLPLGKLIWIAIHPDGTRLMLGHPDSPELQELSIPKLEPIRMLSSPLPAFRGEGKYSPDGRWFASGYGNDVELWDLAGVPVRHVLTGTKARVSTIAFDPTSKWLVWCRAETNLVIHNLHTREDENPLPWGGGYSVDQILFSPNGQHVIVVSFGRSIEVWSWPARRLLYSMGDMKSLRHVTITPDSRRIVTSQGVLRFWDMETGREVIAMKGEYPELLEWNTACFDPTNSKLMVQGNSPKHKGGIFTFNVEVPFPIDDPAPKPSSSAVREIVRSGNTTFLVAMTPGEGAELWKTDGAGEGTVMVRNISPGPTSANPRHLTDVNGTLYFSAYDPKQGVVLWKSDGTTEGTVPVLNRAASNDFYEEPEELFNLNGTLYFSATDQRHGRELWKSDGTPAGTKMIRDIHPGKGDSKPRELTHFKGALFFTAFDPEHDLEMWRSDGTEAGTRLVKDISPGKLFSEPYGYVVYKGSLYFSAYDHVLKNYAMWKTDGTEAGTQLFPAATGMKVFQNGLHKECNGILFFNSFDFKTGNDKTGNGRELWRTDGTQQGTYEVKDIWPGPDPNHGLALRLTALNGNLYFIALDGIHGLELWRSDGTTDGTWMVRDINPGEDGAGTDVLGVGELTILGDKIYFAAHNPTHGIELWRSDGTEAGTVVVKDICPGPGGSRPSHIVNINGTLYFSANDGVHGIQLWKSDGTEAGTVMVTQFGK